MPFFRLRHRFRVLCRMAGPLARDPYVVVPIPIGPIPGGAFTPIGMTHDTYRAYVYVEEWLRLHPDAVESDRFEKFHREILQLAEHGELGAPAVYMLQHPEGYTDWALLDALGTEDEEDELDLEEVDLEDDDASRSL